MEFFRASDNQGFLLVYFLFYPSSGKSPVISGDQVVVKLIESLLGVWGPVNFIPVSFTKRTTKQISIWRTKDLLYINISVSLTFISRSIWKIGLWSDRTVTNEPCREVDTSRILLVNVLSMRVADVAVTLVGRDMIGRNDIVYTNKVATLILRFGLVHYFSQFFIECIDISIRSAIYNTHYDIFPVYNYN